MPPDPTPLRVWVLTGHRRGDNQQVLALAEALGLPFERKSLAYNDWRRLHPRLLGATMASLTPESRAALAGEPPDLTLSIGHRSVPVVRALRQRSRGRMRAVHLGNPRVAPRHFDLVVTTPQYPVAHSANVLRLPLPIDSGAVLAAPGEAAERFLADKPAPRRLLILGGPSRYWTLDPAAITAAIRQLLAKGDGSLLVQGSPRTPAAALAAARTALATSPLPAALVPTEGPPAYRELLAAADELFVTADSVSMVAEALRTGKPVGLVPVRPTRWGRWWMRLSDRLRPGHPVYPRDLRRFWAELEQQGLAGTVDRPRAGSLPASTGQLVERVRRLLALPARPATGGRASDPPRPANPA